ncbi:MAG: hypothetical protein HY903_06245 [Deltaproteobacteria bacterium]|nr:hypothetical protein [Deltaproteobacteria bacterium]
MLPRLIAIPLSALLLAGVGRFVLKGVAAQGGRALEATRELVKAGAAQIEFDLHQQGRELSTDAERFAGDQALAADLKGLAAVLAISPPSGKVPERLRARIEALKNKLLEQVAVLKEQKPHLAAVTVVDGDGVVLLSDSSIFKIGDRLAAPKAEEEEEATAVEGGDVDRPADGTATAPPPSPPKPVGKGGFVLTALDDEVQQVTAVEAGHVVWYGAAPVALRGTTVGAVILEAKLTSLPRVTGTDALLAVGDTVTLGKAPKGFELAALGDTDQPHLLVEHRVLAKVPGLGEVGAGPWYTEPATIGVWAARFGVPGAAGVRGLVFTDVTAFYSELASFQVLVLVFLVLLFVVQVLALSFVDFPLRRGVERIADFLGRINQGKGDERQLPDRAWPRSLSRLVLLLNKTLLRTAGAGVVASLPRSPTLDDVLQAHRSEPAPDVSDFEFRGISDAGSLGIGLQPGSAAPVATATPAKSARPPASPEPEAATLGTQAPDDRRATDEMPAVTAPDVASAAAAEAGLEDLVEAEPMPADLNEAPAPEPVGPVTADVPAFVGPGAPVAAAAPVLDKVPAVTAAVSAVLSDADFAPQPPAAEAAVQAPAGRGAQLGDLLDEFATDATTMMQLSPQLMAAMREMASPAAAASPNASSAAAGAVAASGGDEALAALANEMAAANAPDVRPAPPPATAPTFDAGKTNVMPLAMAKELAARVAADGAAPAAPATAHYREVFQEFVETRKKCGENATDLTFEKFVAKLDKSKEAVIAKHQCSDVRFQVYVKDGKAALKALPAR